MLVIWMRIAKTSSKLKRSSYLPMVIISCLFSSMWGFYFSHFHNCCLDLHCSSEDEVEDDDDMMEEVKTEFDDSSAIDYNQTQVAAAEAMMQLGNFAYYTASGSGSWKLWQYINTLNFRIGSKLCINYVESPALKKKNGYFPRCESL